MDNVTAKVSVAIRRFAPIHDLVAPFSKLFTHLKTKDLLQAEFAT